MILRGDLDLTPGKAAAKAVQAAVNAFDRSPSDRTRAYLADGEGTQVILLAPDEAALRAAHRAATARDLPCALYPESLGIGPAFRHEVAGLTEELPLM